MTALPLPTTIQTYNARHRAEHRAEPSYARPARKYKYTLDAHHPNPIPIWLALHYVAVSVLTYRRREPHELRTMLIEDLR